jgi:hypothetical protein
MNGPDHYDLAEQLLEHAASMLDTDVAGADIHLSGANLTGNDTAGTGTRCACRIL